MLFKPKWEHKDPRVRARAVAEIDDPQLIEVLPQLAANDPDPAVRLQAARRVTDIHEIARLAEKPDDPAVADYARRNLRDRLAATDESAGDLASRLKLLARFEDAELTEHLAREASATPLRRAAVERVTRPALLGDIALGDPDPELRRLAASMIDSASTLERVASKSRTSDKRVYRIVTERLTGLRLEAGDPGELRRQADALCLALEELTRSDQDREHKRVEFERVLQQWSSLGQAPPELTARFVGGRRILEAALAGGDDADARGHSELEHYLADIAAQNDSADLDLLQRSIDRGEALRQKLAAAGQESDARLTQTVASLTERRQRLLAEQDPAPALIALCERAEKIDPRRARDKQLAQLRASWDRAWNRIAEHRPADQSLQKRFDAVLTRLTEELALRSERRAHALERLGQTLDTLEARLEEGDLSGAVKSKQRLLDDLALIGSSPRVTNARFKGRVAAVRRRLHELRDWQHWANNKIRARLCEEAEAITGSGMHPDAVAEKVKALNAQWRELEDSEHLPGDDPNRPASPRLGRRFRAACNRAFLPAKDYFKKRAEIREKHLGEVEALCAGLEAAAADAGKREFSELERTVSRARRGFRQLRKIPPRERSAMSRRLREGIAAIDERLDGHYQIIRRRKERIIEEVTALADEPDMRQAVAAAKEAQRAWQRAGRCRRRDEQKLWTRFRAASDQVFARLDEQRSEQKAQRQAQSQALKDLMAEARKLRDADPAELDHPAGELNRLKDRWRAAGSADRRVASEFNGLVRDIEQAWESARAKRAADQRRGWRELALACQDQEQRMLAGETPDLDAIRERQETVADGAPEELTRRVAALLEGGPGSIDPASAGDRLESALELCIRMEFLAGVETPKQFRDARMAYQVKRLAQRMSGADLPSPQEEVATIEQGWLGCGPLPAAEAPAINQRFLHALEAFDKRSQGRAS